jgi:hypothetical protein
MRACTIYRTQKKLIVVCMHETDAKFYKLAEPVKVLESWNDAAEVGRAVLEIIHNSQHGLPAATTGLGIVPIILKAAGVKSWRKLELQSVECIAELNDGIVQLTPTERTGDNAGVHLPEQKVRTTTAPEDLGNAVLNLLLVGDGSD